MQVRCPQCHEAMEVAGDTELSGVVCPTCGSAFNLLPTTATYTPTTRSIGHFQLLEQLGRGGFGSVWKARDNKLDRLVAIKIPRDGQVDEANTELFLREARASAQLKHSGIVSVHEVGREDGTVYIVSDLIQGVTLADRLTAGPFAPREAAELCVQVAEALHHAHEAGVIHRDLKPSNIMLDGDGEPHVMDFGLARRDTGEITMTVEGKVLGTAGYMSPEQARGEGHSADRRTDVYSLGVILFQLLTGERPFRGNERMLLHQVLHDESPSPRKLNSRIPRDLETICLKCLQKSPDRRYRTTELLADDVRRWLDGKPILARPVGRVERLFRWARRQPVVATLVATVAIVTIIGFAAVTWQWRTAVAANAAAEKNLEESEKQRIRRGVNFDRALEAVDKMLTHVGEQQMLTPELAPVRKKVLEDALKLYEGLLEEKSDDPALRAETAQAAMRVGAIRGILDEPDAAIASYRQAVVILARLNAEFPENLGNLLDLGRCHNAIGRVLFERDKFPEAADSHRTAITLVSPSASPSNAISLEFLARVNHEFGRALLNAGRRQEAVAAAREAIKYGEQMLAIERDRKLPAYSLSIYYAALANSLDTIPGEEPEAEQCLRRAIELHLVYMSTNGPTSLSYTPGFLPTVPDLETTSSLAGIMGERYTRLAGLLRRVGRDEEADQFEQKAIQIRALSIEKLKANVSQSTSSLKHVVTNQMLARDYRGQGRLLKQQGNAEQATEHLQWALDIYTQLAKETPAKDSAAAEYYRRSMIETTLELLPLVAKDVEEWKANIALVDRMRRQMKELGASTTNDVIFDDKEFQALTFVVGLKTPFGAQAKVPRQLDEYVSKQALVVAERMAKRDAKRRETIEALRWSHQRRGDFLLPENPAEAASHLQQSVALGEQLIAAHGITELRAVGLGRTYINLTKALMSTQPTAEFLPLAMRSLELRKYLERRNRKELEGSYDMVAKALAHCKGVGDSDLRKAIDASREQTVKGPNPMIAWRALGIGLARQKHYEEASQALRKSYESELPEKMYDLFFLAICLEHLGQHDEASELLAKGSTLLDARQPNNKLLKSLEQEVMQVVGAK